MLCAAPDAGPPFTPPPKAAADAAGACPPRKCNYPGFGNCGRDGFAKDSCLPAAPIPARDASALEGLKGFQKAEWGMTEAQVVKFFPGGKVTGDKAKRTLALRKDVANLAAELRFVFDGSKGLVEVVVAFDDQQRGYADWRQVCTAVTNALTERYGGGFTSEEVLESYSVRWPGKLTNVQLDCSGLAIWPKTRVALFYSDRAFEEAQPAVKSDDL